MPERPVVLDRNIHDVPEFLYHYTSIDTLEAILKNRSIKFSRLDTFNDAYEGESADLASAKRSVYASCWMSDPDDLVHHWKMYGDDMKGVRIKLPAIMFELWDDCKPMVYPLSGINMAAKHGWKFEIDGDTRNSANCIIYGPNKIEYTNDISKLEHSCFTASAGWITFDLSKVGLVKQSGWKSEVEWRFTLNNWGIDNYPMEIDRFPSFLNSLETRPVYQEAVFVGLDPVALDQMEIMIGPKASAGDASRVDQIRQTYAPSAVVVRSPLRPK